MYSTTNNNIFIFIISDSSCNFTRSIYKISIIQRDRNSFFLFSKNIIYINKLMVKWGPAKIKNTAVELYFASGIFLKYSINATLYIHV